jgi:hypothetical protein
MRKIILLGAVALFATACVSKKEYEAQLAQAAALSAEKDWRTRNLRQRPPCQ